MARPWPFPARWRSGGWLSPLMVAAIALAASPLVLYFLLQFGPFQVGGNLAYGAALLSLVALAALYTLSAAWTAGVRGWRVALAWAFALAWSLFVVTMAVAFGVNGCFEHPDSTTFCTFGG